MSSFARYYLDLFIEIFNDIVNFFKTIFGAIVSIFTNLGKYFSMLVDASKDFDVVAWILTVIVTVLNFTLVFFVTVRIVQILKRYFIFRAKEVEKDQLIEEIALLNQKAQELVNEKNSIMALKISQLGLNPNGTSEYEEDKSIDEKALPNSRFVKLIAVDKKYARLDMNVKMQPDDMLTLSQIVDRFVNFAASQMRLYYTHKTIALYLAGMATSKIIILEGISGTGKTSLPYSMSKFFKNDAAIISVQPSWRDRAELLGYLNEFTKRFNETDFLKSLYEVTYRKDINYIVLDEMNLARIEYYFAEFLSILEMPDHNEWRIDIVPDTLPTDPKNLKNGKITVPQNVWFIGTANKDDSTFIITDKVYDRAVTISLNNKGKYFDAPYTDNMQISYDYLNSLYEKAWKDHQISNKVLENFTQLDLFIQEKFKIAFGNRIMKQIRLFVPVYMACGGNELEGLDYMLTYKILRKFEALNLTFLKDEIDQLIAMLNKLFGKDVFKESISYLLELKKIS
jgi:hypothetical protein